MALRKKKTFNELQFDIKEIWQKYAVPVNARLIVDIARLIANKYIIKRRNKNV